jgi:hypothetical protein
LGGEQVKSEPVGAQDKLKLRFPKRNKEPHTQRRRAGHPVKRRASMKASATLKKKAAGRDN